LVRKISDAISISQETMKEALQVERDSEMNSPTAITYPGLPASVISDPAETKEKVRTRGSSNPPRVTRRGTSKRSPSLKGRVAPTRTDALEQNILQELFLTSRKRFVGIAYRILRNKEAAEDAVQDAFLSACRHLREFEGRSALTTWFTRIVMNAALMMRRKRKNAPPWRSHEMDEAMSSLAETVPDIYLSIPLVAKLRVVWRRLLALTNVTHCSATFFR
jgi:hypothetical protein